MRTDDCTVMINAAFLAEIKEDNHELRKILAELQQLCCRGAKRIEPEKLSELLGDLRDNLALHFSLEETYGYMQEPVAVAPHLYDRAEKLRQDHDSLFQQVNDLANKAEALLYPWIRHAPIRRVVERFWGFRQRLLAHEAAENDLVCEAFHRDLGIGD